MFYIMYEGKFIIIIVKFLIEIKNYDIMECYILRFEISNC